jgi:hypothetical protein
MQYLTLDESASDAITKLETADRAKHQPNGHSAYPLTTLPFFVQEQALSPSKGKHNHSRDTNVTRG